MQEAEIRERFREFVGRDAPRKLIINTDTTEFMEIERDQVILLNGRCFAVRGNAVEGRFGIDDQPKFWVKSCTDLLDGSRKFLKLEFHEEMTTSLGPLKYRCMRSPEKEAFVLDTFRGDERFMQGCSERDTAGNNVRILDYIRGSSLYTYITNTMHMPHEQYFETYFSSLFTRMISSVEAIAVLHKHNVCHGDIRNDHILIQKEDKQFRWIDFDLKQVSLDFDVWSLGNIVFLVCGGRDVTCRRVKSGEFGECTIEPSDCLAFYPHRLANLQKVFPYIPDSVNRILMKYSAHALDQLTQYKTVFHLLDDLKQCCQDNEFDNCPLITVDPLNPTGL